MFNCFKGYLMGFWKCFCGYCTRCFFVSGITRWDSGSVSGDSVPDISLFQELPDGTPEVFLGIVYQVLLCFRDYLMGFQKFSCKYYEMFHCFSDYQTGFWKFQGILYQMLLCFRDYLMGFCKCFCGYCTRCFLVSGITWQDSRSVSVDIVPDVS